MEARIKNPAMLLPEAMTAIQSLHAAIEKGDVSPKLLGLTHLRASQINGCAVCIDGGFRLAKREGESDERLFAVAAWRDAPYFTDAERAALELTEYVTRLADRPDPVPDAIWNEAKTHFNERALAALLLHIAVTNVFNRLNVATRQIAGAWKP